MLIRKIKEVQGKLQEYKEKIVSLRIENSKLSKRLSENQEKYHKLKSNLETLKNITERYEGYGNSIKRVMELKDLKKV